MNDLEINYDLFVFTSLKEMKENVISSISNNFKELSKFFKKVMHLEEFMEVMIDFLLFRNPKFCDMTISAFHHILESTDLTPKIVGDYLNKYFNQTKQRIRYVEESKQANKPEEKYYLPENMNSKFTEQQFSLWVLE